MLFVLAIQLQWCSCDGHTQRSSVWYSMGQCLSTYELVHTLKQANFLWLGLNPQTSHQRPHNCVAGGGGGPGGGGGGSFVHYDALEISKNVGHHGHGNAEVSFVAADFSSLNTFIHERATLKSSPHTPKASPRRQLSWPS